jgi:hypothetical protein
MRSIMIATLAATVAVTGCTNNPYTGAKVKPVKRLGVQRLVCIWRCMGAATGDNKKDRRERALKGAAIGGVVGGGVGAYMDVQEKKLREKLQGSGVGVYKSTKMVLLLWLCQVILPSQQVKADIKGDFFEP